MFLPGKLIVSLVLLMVLLSNALFAQDRTVVYKKIDSLELKMYIFNPKGHKSDDNTPCIVFFHGGGWNNGHPKSFFKQAKYLASRVQKNASLTASLLFAGYVRTRKS